MKSARSVLLGLCWWLLCACGDADLARVFDASSPVGGDDAGSDASVMDAGALDAGAAGDSAVVNPVGDAAAGSAQDGAAADTGATAGDSGMEPATGPDPFALQEEDGLPVVHLWVASEVNDADYVPAVLVYRGHSYQGVQAKFRGKTSLRYPKKSFTIKLAKNDLFAEPAQGMNERRRIVLTTTFDDNSYVRQRMAYALWNRLDPTIEVRSYNAVLYLNGAYHGLYLVGDHIDDELMEASGLWPHGNLYKARTNDANFRLVDRRKRRKESLARGYTKEEGSPAAHEDGAFDDLLALVRWVAEAPAEQIVAEIDWRLDRADFEAWLVLVSSIEATDSEGKNSYLYHDARLDAPDARWHCVPWDFNASFGQNYRTRRLQSDRLPEIYGDFNALFAHLVTIPELQASLAQRYHDALNRNWKSHQVLALFDAYSDEVAAAAERDEQLWGEAMRDFWNRDPFNTYAEERAYTRQWIADRWALLERRFR